jgi:hypothetical protein
MKYEKPELVVLARATSAIKGMKDSPFAYDGIPQPAHYITTAAYDCDE